MKELDVGDVPPPFRLPSGQGPEIGPEDYRGKRLVVWFTKGFGCSFCRAHMTQIARTYPEIRERDAEVLEVSISKPSQGRLYLKKFSLPFPYLCDSDHEVRRSWGLGVRSQPFSRFVRKLVDGARRTAPPSDFGPDFAPPVGEMLGLLKDDDAGFFVLDRSGVVRFRNVGSYLVGRDEARSIPTRAEILQALDSCD